MGWKSRVQVLANPECSDCGGEGVCHYARGEDSFTDVCDTCFPNGCPEEDTEAWRDE